MSTLFLLLMLAAVLTSLGLALYFLVRDRGTTERTVKALTWRTLLSILLFIVLLTGGAIGLIGHHRPAVAPPTTERAG